MRQLTIDNQFDFLIFSFKLSLVNILTSSKKVIGKRWPDKDADDEDEDKQR